MPHTWFPLSIFNRPCGTFVWAKGVHPSLISKSTTSEFYFSGTTLKLYPQVETISWTLRWSLTVKGIPYLLIYWAFFMFISAKKFNYRWNGSEHLDTNVPNFYYPVLFDNSSRDKSNRDGLVLRFVVSFIFYAWRCLNKVLLLHISCDYLGVIRRIVCNNLFM